MSGKKIVLIGAGAWGKNHLKNLQNMGVLHSVLETSATVTAQRRKEFPEVAFTREEGEILDNENVSAAVICAPAALHHEIARKCLAAGKDVLVEKPLALRYREGKELVALAERGKRILMVGHVLQYHPAVVRLKELVDDGDLGEIRYIYSNRLNIGKLRAEENVWWSFAPHDISLILRLLDDEMPARVAAFGGNYINDGVADTTLTNLDFVSGVKAHIFVSWLHPFKEQKLVVVGSRQMAVFDDVAAQKLTLFPHKVDFTPERIPVVHKAESVAVQTDAAEPLLQELRHFVECLDSRRTPLTDGKEGLRVLQVLEMAQKSLEEKSR